MGRGTPSTGFRWTPKRKHLYGTWENFLASEEAQSLASSRGINVDDLRDTRDANGNIIRDDVPESDDTTSSYTEPKTESAAPMTETVQEMDARIRQSFDILHDFVKSAIAGDIRSLIISGPPGLGKSYSVEQALYDFDPAERKHTRVSGYVRMTGLFKTLYKYRHPGCVVVFDDSDTIFDNQDSLNLLKAACDTSRRRRLSYLSEAVLVTDGEGDEIEQVPKYFIGRHEFCARNIKGKIFG